jgi:hypothetical protein
MPACVAVNPESRTHPATHCTVILNAVKDQRLPLGASKRCYVRIAGNTPRALTKSPFNSYGRNGRAHFRQSRKESFAPLGRG